MMAEQKFSDAIKQIESLLVIEKTERHELLFMYYEASLKLQREPSIDFILELAQIEVKKKDYVFAEKLLANGVLKTNPVAEEMRIILYDEQGKLFDLYNEIKRSLLSRIENKNPYFPSWVNSRIEKYFKNDFHFKLFSLTSLLHINDLKRAEDLMRDILFRSFEKPTGRIIGQNLTALLEILKQTESKGHLEIYQSFCHLYLNGITEKKDYKKLIENIIYFEDFKFQVFLLDLIVRLGLNDEAHLYAQTLKSNQGYSFVYLDKYFKNLKKYFYQQAPDNESEATEAVDLMQDSSRPSLKWESNEESKKEEFPESEEDALASKIIKFQDFSFNQLCDLSVGFLQAEVPRVAFIAAEKALKQVQSGDQYLKVKYLMMSSLLMAGDYRAVIDIAYEALGKAENQEDILSFLYGQAEAFIKLQKKEEARHVLSRIISIDDSYRLAKMRLLKLNEV